MYLEIRTEFRAININWEAAEPQISIARILEDNGYILIELRRSIWQQEKSHF